MNSLDRSSLSTNHHNNENHVAEQTTTKTTSSINQPIKHHQQHALNYSVDADDDDAYNNQQNHRNSVLLNNHNHDDTTTTSPINDITNCARDNDNLECDAHDSPNNSTTNTHAPNENNKSFDDEKSLSTISTALESTIQPADSHQQQPPSTTGHRYSQPRGSVTSRGSHQAKKSQIIIRKFQKLDQSLLSSTPAPDVKIGQRVAYKEYYGSEFGTIRWIGRVPQICPDWTAGVEFDNAIGEGDGSLNGRRYFIAKDCFAKFLPLNAVALVDQHVGRPEPGTMISVMSAAVKPGQMISIQRVSTVHVQHCFLNAPHHRPGPEILAVNTRLHCQCPNCGPCAHVIKPPSTQRLARMGKNATHMCQFSTYTCCGMKSQEEAMCTYTGNKIASLPTDHYGSPSSPDLPPLSNSWIEGAGYLSNLQAQQSKLLPDEYRLGAAPDDVVVAGGLVRNRSKRASGHHKHHHRKHHKHSAPTESPSSANQELIVAEGHQHVDENRGTTNCCTNDDGDATRQALALRDVEFYSSEMQTYSVNHQNAIESSDNNQFAVANPDKVNGFEDYNYLSNFSDNNNSNTAQVNNKTAGSKGAKVIYRDSIDNRYLFPTDEDPIDSTLERDIENLSQARYGHSANLRLNGSRNIFKSLRSLVSCLNVNSNNSDFEENFKQETLKYSAHHTTTREVANKAVPLIRSPSSATTCKPDAYCSSHMASNQESKSKDEYIQAHCVSNDSNHVQYQHQPQPKQEQQKCLPRQISSSSDCGFSSASQNSINFQTSYPACSPALSTDDDRRTNLVYKRIVARLMSLPGASFTNEDLLRLKRILFDQPHFDSCCLHNGTTNQMPSLKNFNNSEVDHIVADIIQRSYLQPDQKGSEQASSKVSCCHATNYCLTGPGIEMDKIEERYSMKSERMCRKMVLEEGSSDIASSIQNNHPDAQHDAVSSGTKPRNFIGSTSSTSGSVTLSSYDSFSGPAMMNDNPASVTLNSMEGKKKDRAKVEDKLIDNANLPKAFELKLTLSINSDSNKNVTATTQTIPLEIVPNDHSSSSNAHENAEDPEKILNLTTNINISPKETANDDVDLTSDGLAGDILSEVASNYNQQANPIEEEQSSLPNQHALSSANTSLTARI